jgi:hypothetical protein
LACEHFANLTVAPATLASVKYREFFQVNYRVAVIAKTGRRGIYDKAAHTQVEQHDIS